MLPLNTPLEQASPFTFGSRDVTAVRRAVAEKFAVEGSLRESGVLLLQHGATQLITAVRMMRDLILKSLCLRKKLLWEYIG